MLLSAGLQYVMARKRHQSLNTIAVSGHNYKVFSGWYPASDTISSPKELWWQGCSVEWLLDEPGWKGGEVRRLGPTATRSFCLTVVGEVLFEVD